MLDPFFRENFGLPWQRGDYHHTTFAVNVTAVKHIGKAAQRLVPAYSQKAMHLRHVEKAHSMYLPTPESRVESLLFSAERIKDLKQTPIAWVKVGLGWIEYVGDVNAEEESDEVTLAMCGLLA